MVGADSDTSCVQPIFFHLTRWMSAQRDPGLTSIINLTSRQQPCVRLQEQRARLDLSGTYSEGYDGGLLTQPQPMTAANGRKLET